MENTFLVVVAIVIVANIGTLVLSVLKNRAIAEMEMSKGRGREPELPLPPKTQEPEVQRAPQKPQTSANEGARQTQPVDNNDPFGIYGFVGGMS